MAISATVIGPGCLGRAAHRGSLGADVRVAGGGAVEKWVDAPKSGQRFFNGDNADEVLPSSNLT